MKARIPDRLSTIAQKGDVLVLGRFEKPGSPAADKEPFLAFHKADDLFKVVCLRNGAELKILAPSLPQFDGWIVRYLVQKIHPKTLRIVEEGRFLFTGENPRVVRKSKLPLDIKVLVIEEQG